MLLPCVRGFFSLTVFSLEREWKEGVIRHDKKTSTGVDRGYVFLIHAWLECCYSSKTPHLRLMSWLLSDQVTLAPVII